MTKELTLTSLAMLRVKIDGGGNYLDYLKPFLLQTITTQKIKVIDDSLLTKKLQEECGLVIPKRTVQIVLQRLSRDGYFKKIDGSYHIIREINVSFSAEKAEASRNITAVLNDLIAFALANSGKTVSEEEAIEIIIAFLSRFSMNCLRSFLQGTALPQVNDEDWKIVLVCQYVKKISETHPERFNSFILLVKGHMLANALLCPDLQSVSQSYKDVVFYIDTPLLFQLLGLEGEEKSQVIFELLALLKNLKGRIACFSHTLEETVNAIKKSSDFIDSRNGYGSIVYEARKTGKTKSDLLLIAEMTEERLVDIGLEIHPTPPYIHKLQIDQVEFDRILSNQVNYIHNPRAKDYDINSVRSIYVLRKNEKPRSIEKSIAILVTSNSAFAKAAYEYGKNIEQSIDTSPVITDFSLANISWLKAPQGSPMLPQKEVMAFAYAALHPPREFFEKVLRVAEKLEKEGKISARDHQILRSSALVQEELMGVTLGEESQLSEEKITETINRVSLEIKKEENEKYMHEKTQHQKTLGLLKKQIENTEKIKANIYWQCTMIANGVSGAVAIIFLGLNIWVMIFGLNIKDTNSLLGYSLIIIPVGIGIMSLWFGTSLNQIRMWIKELVQSHLYKIRLKWLGIDLE